MKNRAKITIIGAGFVGSTAAHWIAAAGLGDIVLLDLNKDTAKGKALDLLQAMPIERSDVRISGTDSYADTQDSDVIVITAGVPRKPGMSRDDLLNINAGIMRDVAVNVAKNSPNAIVIVVSNPLDAMVYLAWKGTGFPTQRIVGMAGILDSARMRTFIAKALDVSVADVTALVMGGHGDTMVPLMRFANVNGVPVKALLSEQKIAEIVERTQNGGAEIVNYLKTGSAYFAPGAAVKEMVEAIVHDKKRVLPCAAYLNGEYGVEGLFVGVPVVLGARGVEKVLEMPLDAAEKELFAKTVEHVMELIKGLET